MTIIWPTFLSFLLYSFTTIPFFVSCAQLDMDRARYLVEQAFEEDAQDNKEEAFELYAQAAELCLSLVNNYETFIRIFLTLCISYEFTLVKRTLIKLFQPDLLAYNRYCHNGQCAPFPSYPLYIVACQAYPALVKIAPVLIPFSFQ